MMSPTRRTATAIPLVLLAISPLMGCGGEDEQAGPEIPAFPSDEAEVPAEVPTDPSAAMAGREPAAFDNDVLTVAGISMIIPEGWVNEPPANAMRAAQFAIPPEDPAIEPAVVTVSQSIGGPVDFNINRWINQVGREREDAELWTTDAEGGLVAHQVFATGTYQSGIPGDTTPPLEDTSLLGAVVTGGPQGQVYIKIVGPNPVVQSAREGWDELIASLSPAAAEEGT